MSGVDKAQEGTMTENPPVEPTTPAAPLAKKAAAKKATAKKAAAKAQPENVAIEFVGNSRGIKHGERQKVVASRAEDLVQSGLARYVE